MAVSDRRLRARAGLGLTDAFSCAVSDFDRFHIATGRVLDDEARPSFLSRWFTTSLVAVAFSVDAIDHRLSVLKNGGNHLVIKACREPPKRPGSLTESFADGHKLFQRDGICESKLQDFARGLAATNPNRRIGSVIEVRPIFSVLATRVLKAYGTHILEPCFAMS
jgi:hypothetical protein